MNGSMPDDHHATLVDGKIGCLVCGVEKAVWSIASGKTEKFYCNDHVPRGYCNCNAYRGDLNPRHPLAERQLDDDGRELPCVDFWYDPDGYEVS